MQSEIDYLRIPKRNAFVSSIADNDLDPSVRIIAGNQLRVVNEAALQVTSIFQKTGEHAILDHAADADEEVLVALGYNQEFRRDFSIWSSFSVSFSVLGLLPSVSSTLGYNFGYIGIAGSVWGWLVGAFLVQFVALAMAELCSAMPTSGGLYYAAAVLAPTGWGPLFAWITGWSNFLGLAIAQCAINYALASMVLAAAEIGSPNYSSKTWQLYLLFLVLSLIQGYLTQQRTSFIGRMNNIGAVLNFALVFIFIIWMPVGSIGMNSHSKVWTHKGISNGTEWPDGFAFLMGFLSVILTLAGYDAPFHLSEECSNASIASPRAIVMTAQLGMWLGWAIIIVIAYTVKDITSLVNSKYGQPMGSLCLQVLGERAGLALFALNIIAQLTIAASRVTYAYSRDGALPFSSWLSRVNKNTQTPVNAIWFIIICSALIGLLMFAGPVVIGAVFSLAVIAQYVAFTIPIALKVFLFGDRFHHGPWNLGRFSKPVGIIACSWVALFIPILCFPASRGPDLNRKNMNYACLIYGGSMLLAVTWYMLFARHWFKGPRVNVQRVKPAEDARKVAQMHRERSDIGESKRPL